MSRLLFEYILKCNLFMRYKAEFQHHYSSLHQLLSMLKTVIDVFTIFINL